MLRDRLKELRTRNMFPHTVTIYNVLTFTDKTSITERTVNFITVLHGVMLDAVKAVNVLESGDVSADAVTLYIPFGVKALDGITGKPKLYVGPMEWTRLAQTNDIEKLRDKWTMTLDGEGDGDTFFVKDEVVEPNANLMQISFLYDHVYNITKVDEMDFGGKMAHWEVGGA